MLPGEPLNVPPVFASSFRSGGEREYARNEGTPTWAALEDAVGRLEGGAATAYASGMGRGRRSGPMATKVKTARVT